MNNIKTRMIFINKKKTDLNNRKMDKSSTLLEKVERIINRVANNVLVTHAFRTGEHSPNPQKKTAQSLQHRHTSDSAFSNKASTLT